jgi:N-acetylglucosamine-6-sulfatase
MTRKSFLRSFAAALPFLTTSGRVSGQAPKKRNIVLILAGDHRWDMMGAAGHPWLQTPNLDKLIDGGAFFENAFVTTSLSTPSRVSFLTGQYAHEHGVLDTNTPIPKGAPAFPELLKQNGYRTAWIGRWHTGGEGDDPRPGYNRWVSFRGEGVFQNPTLNIDGERKKATGYTADILAEEARKFMGHASAEPFLLVVSHRGGNNEFQPHDKFRSHFSNETIPYPKSMANTEQNYRGRPAWVRRQRESWLGVDAVYNRRFNFDQLYRNYCRCLLSLDESVGAVMNELSKRRLLSETLILYVSDNGFQLGEHGLIDSRTMYEASIRIPLIAHCPELVKPGIKIAPIVLNLDIAPTVLDVAGIPAPAMHGSSLMPLIRGTSESLRSEFVYEYFWDRDYPYVPATFGLRTGRYCLSQYQGVWDLDELYDLEEDPEQMNNLLGGAQLRTDNRSLAQRVTDPEVRTLLEGLQERLSKSLKESGWRRDPRTA